MKKIWNTFQEKLDNYELKKKMYFLFLFCVLFPLIVTDSVIVYNFLDAERSQRKHEMENISNAVEYSFYNNIDSVARIAKSIYMNKSIDEFLGREYENPLDYVTGYQSFIKDTMLDDSFGLENTRIRMYSDNETIVNGGEFARIDTIKDTPWYQYMTESGKEQFLYFYYYDGVNSPLEAKRKTIFVRRLNFYSNSKMEKIVTLEMDYSKMVRDLVEMNYDVPIFICLDNKILLSNKGYSNVGTDFSEFQMEKEVAYTKTMSLYGMELQIHILQTNGMIVTEIVNNLPILLMLLMVNIVLPLILMAEINRSFTSRIRKLSEAFERVDDERLTMIEDIQGHDEIGSLMNNYNRMVIRINDLIQTVYKDKLREQEIDISRQKAELLALQSQINPHFMFNALESIRMHSIIKKEYETADMVEKLAVMERQNVEWSEDCIEIRKEIEFVNAYLGLQKYRFGDRLSYQIEMDEACGNLRIPRLTIVTFVENACVHGIESKTTPGWIFLRVYQERDELCIEVEDTGCGMEEDAMEELHKKMTDANIELLKKKGRVGIVNACLRLKMITNDHVTFGLKSEKGVGTMVQIRIPVNCL